MLFTSPTISKFRHLARVYRPIVLVIPLFIALVFLSAPRVLNAQNLETASSALCLELFANASDVNDDGLALSVADYVLLLRVIAGDTTLNSPCITELDFHENSFFPCAPNIGDAAAYGRYLAFGLASVPAGDCSLLSQPQVSDLEIVAPGPLTMFGQSTELHTVSLRNTGSTSAFVWGLTVPFELQLMGSDMEQFNLTVQNLHSSGGWSSSIVQIDSNYALVSFYPDGPGSPAPVEIGPGEELALFDFYIDWLTLGRALATPRLHVTTPQTAPYVVASSTFSGIPPTGILTMTLDECCGQRGDANSDGRLSIADVTHLIEFIFGDHGVIGCRAGADINRDNAITISDVTTGIGYIFVGAPSLTCGSCPLQSFVDDSIFIEMGDVNRNEIAYEIADWVTLDNYLVRGLDALIVSPVDQLLGSEVDSGCEPGTVADLVTIERVALGHLFGGVPNPVEHYATTAIVSRSAEVVSTDSRTRAMLLVFPGQTTVQLLAPDMSLDTAFVDGYTRALVTNGLAFGGPYTFIGNIVSANQPPISIEAADSLGALYQVEIVTAP